jgi:glutamate racemase
MIGFFDSGVGGLSIYRAVHQLLPQFATMYIGDHAHVPYGTRTHQQVRQFTTAIIQFLINHNANPIIIACNTASGASLQYLRNEYPDINFIGLVPAIKPAAETTRTGRIGVLATPGTFRGKLYMQVKTQFASDVVVYQDTCSGLVEEIENGRVFQPTARTILEHALKPMMAMNIDRLVLGCTHYPFAVEVIRDIIGDQIEIIEPGQAIGRRTQFIIDSNPSLQTPEDMPSYRFLSTGNTSVLTNALACLLGWHDVQVEPLVWRNGHQVELA